MSTVTIPVEQTQDTERARLCHVYLPWSRTGGVPPAGARALCGAVRLTDACVVCADLARERAA